MKRKKYHEASKENPIQDYKITGEFNTYFIGAKIIDVFVISKDVKNDCYEGGLTVIFEKGTERGLCIFGYTELGEWVDFFQVGNKVIRGLPKYIEYYYMIEKIIKEYNITDNAEGEYIEYPVEILWDDESFVWVAKSDFGLVMESDSLDILIERIKFASTELLSLNEKITIQKPISLCFNIKCEIK